ncbi:NAD(P)H-hydrate dehydratase [Luteolibacter flavescens]|uniref:ADP-dependent (S)-NAD(P)H-hydrate dehydratase n=1 Tax=Luteolibacter flavescens TaxID=1859460 RepID=A0ABT3FVH2_9BACT|nr:NAD(P)H-hydrate dehydratase [Luteolibacter flavescens]MCW1887577.1 NAD(P)H-hydrate dehydratase [Luteolibacter flavescens]
MSFVTGAAMRSLEESAFSNGISAEYLMDQAGEGIARRLLDHFPRPGRAVAYLGKGNNAGDALVALLHLRNAGWQISLRAAWPESAWGPLPLRKWQELDSPSPTEVIPEGPRPLLLLDGLLGIGARGTLREPLAPLAEEMAGLRESRGAIVAAMDLPSGMDADTGEGSGITADLTLPVGVAKLGLTTSAGIASAGRILLVPVPDLPPPAADTLAFFCPESFPGLLAPRPHDFHKGNAGRIGLLAGSPGMTGAAVLAATAVLRAGGGLITLHGEPGFLSSLSSPMPPEIMVRSSATPVADAFSAGHHALIIGPGMGNMAEDQKLELLTQLATSSIPAVLDADALNLLATTGRTDLLERHHLITPHPGEFRRLAPDLAELDRVEAAAAFVGRHPCTLLLKGTRTLVATAGKATRFNPTGHAGMASGGQGDVLSGVAGTFLAQGVQPADAASLAAWLCGRAAERALAKGPITTAGDTIDELGGAMRDWQERRR